MDARYWGYFKSCSTRGAAAADETITARTLPRPERVYTRRSKGTAMAHLNVIWEDSALRMLETRDRYMRNAIREEFRRDPTKDAIEIDPDESSFLTPVSNNRFSVIWRLADNLVVVRAVVPLTNLEQLRTLENAHKRTYIGKVVARESKGEIDL